MAKNHKNTFGLEISNMSLTAVEISPGKTAKSGAKIVNYSRINLEPLVVADNCTIMKPEKFKELVRKLLAEGKRGPIKTKNVIISIPEEKTFSHKIDVLKEHEHNEKFIKTIATDYVPIGLDEAIVDYHQVKNFSKDKNVINMNFVAVQKNVILPLIEILKEVGLDVIGVDIDRNAVMRYCNNSLHPNKVDFMVVDVKPEKSVLSVLAPSGTPYSIEMKAGMDIMMMQTSDTMTLVQKAKRLIRIVSNNEPLQVKTIYITGTHPNMQELKDSFKAEFEGVDVQGEPEYLNREKEIDWQYTASIGLALKSIVPDENGDINLVPGDIKEKLEAKRMEPVLKRYFLLAYILIMGGTLFSSVLMTESYLNYKITSQEINVYKEKAANPYLTETAKATNQRIQMENQINSILEDSVPPNILLNRMEQYNTRIDVMSMDYKINQSNEHLIGLKAKTTGRELTEQLIAALEDDYYFSEVDSPLSNLVGKGERVINIDLIINYDTILSGFRDPEEIAKEEAEKAAAEEASETAATKSAEEDSGAEAVEGAENENPEISEMENPASEEATSEPAPEKEEEEASTPKKPKSPSLPEG